MNLTQLPSTVTASEPEKRDDSPDETAEATRSPLGSWRRKSMLAAGVLGLGLYLRRRRSKSGDDSRSDPSGAERNRGGIGRRLTMFVVTTVAFALARRVIRRFRAD